MQKKSRINKKIVAAAVVIVVVFLVLAINKNIKDRERERITYDGLGEETEEQNYPVSGLNQDYYFTDECGFKGYDDGSTTYKRGIDVSEHQGEIDWVKVKEAGVQFAYIRAGFRTYDHGNLREDICFRYNIENAIANDIDVGVYFFSQAINVEESIEEARFVVDLIKDYDISLPVAHDMEDIAWAASRIDILDRDTKTEIADAFCAIIENYGYDSIIYANASWLLTELNIFKLSGRKIWLANYTDKTLYPFRYEFWQYSDSGTIEGIPEKVDLDIMYIREE